MIYSSSSRYAIRALTHMAGKEMYYCHPIQKVCDELEIPRAYLNKIFKVLVDKKILRSVKGPGGGYAFAKEPESISLLDVKEAIEGESDFTKCALGLDNCNDTAPCPVHHIWKDVRQNLKDNMRDLNLTAAHKVVENKKAAP